MKHRYLTSAAIGLLVAGFAFAQQSPPKPTVQTQIESLRLQVQNDGENAYFHFVEDVVLVATNMTLQCDELEVYASREANSNDEIGKFGAIKEIVATGNVTIVQEERTATAAKAVVQPNQERIVLTGAPATVEQAGGTLEGLEIILNRADGRITVDGSNKRKIRLTGPVIGDLGFEERVPVPTPEDITTMEDEAKAAAESEDDSAPNEEAPEE